MSSSYTPVVLLGPQRLKSTLSSAVRALGVEGRIATVTAGWQEREPEDQELHTHLDGKTINLRLYARAEEVFRRDPEFAAAHKRRQERLRQIQNLYELRLAHGMDAVIHLLRREGDLSILDPERESAMEAVRLLDRQHLERVQEVHAEFDREWRPGERDLIAHERRRIAEILKWTEALAIAGGHIAVLLNRLRLFDLTGMLRGQPVFAWSAGAMVITDRIVLFHDSPPQGRGNPELLDSGLGLTTGAIPLPHAFRRLKLEDPDRVARFVRRFRPARVFALEDGAQLYGKGLDWRGRLGVHELRWNGDLHEMAEEAS